MVRLYYFYTRRATPLTSNARFFSFFTRPPSTRTCRSYFQDIKHFVRLPAAVKYFGCLCGRFRFCAPYMFF